jgi:hypothetical protein
MGENSPSKNADPDKRHRERHLQKHTKPDRNITPAALARGNSSGYEDERRQASPPLTHHCPERDL